MSYPNREMIKGFLENIDYMLESIRYYSQDPIHYEDLTDDQWDLLYHLRRHLKQAEDQAEQLIRSIELQKDSVTEHKSCVTCEYFDPKNKVCEMHPDWEPWTMSASMCNDYGSLDDLKRGDQNV